LCHGKSPNRKLGKFTLPGRAVIRHGALSVLTIGTQLKLL